MTHIDGLVQDCSKSSALAMELLQLINYSLALSHRHDKTNHEKVRTFKGRNTDTEISSFCWHFRRLLHRILAQASG